MYAIARSPFALFTAMKSDFEKSLFGSASKMNVSPRAAVISSAHATRAASAIRIGKAASRAHSEAVLKKRFPPLLFMEVECRFAKTLSSAFCGRPQKNNPDRMDEAALLPAFAG